ncbi:hypothetical protein [Streptomyces sp. NPDC048309]|uniref:hypothetical protein n=1 Tax=Streptomyces sp. NPDC048309 TaxID=3154618 RepID=UPI00340E0225
MTALEQFRQQHGTPEKWCTAEFDEYLEIGDQEIVERLLVSSMPMSRSGRVTTAASAWERGLR